MSCRVADPFFSYLAFRVLSPKKEFVLWVFVIDLANRQTDNIARGQEFVASVVDEFHTHDDTHDLVDDFLFMR